MWMDLVAWAGLMEEKVYSRYSLALLKRIGGSKVGYGMKVRQGLFSTLGMDLTYDVTFGYMHETHDVNGSSLIIRRRRYLFSMATLAMVNVHVRNPLPSLRQLRAR